MLARAPIENTSAAQAVFFCNGPIHAGQLESRQAKIGENPSVRRSHCANYLQPLELPHEVIDFRASCLSVNIESLA